MAKVLFLLCIPEEDETDNAKKNKKEEAKDSDADTPKHGSGVDAEKKPETSIDDQIQGSAKSQELPASSNALAVEPSRQDERKTSITSAPGGTVSSDVQEALCRQSSPSSTTKSVPADVKKALSTPAEKDNSAFSSQPALSSPNKEKSELPMSASLEDKEVATPKILIQNENAEEIGVEGVGKEGKSAAALPAVVSQAEDTQGVTTEGGNPLEKVKDDYWDFDTPDGSVEGLTIEDEFHDCEEGPKKSKASKKVKPKKRDSSPPNSAKSKQDEKKKDPDSKAEKVEESEFVTCPNTPVPQSKFTVEPVSDKPQEGTGKVTADQSPDTSEKSKKNTDKFTVEPVAAEPKPVSGKSKPDVELTPPKAKQSSSNPTPEAVSVPVSKSSSAAVKSKESGLEQPPGAHTVPATGGTGERNGSLPQLETRRSITPTDSLNLKDVKAGSEEFEMVEFLPKTTMRKQVRECLEAMGVKNMAWQKCVGDKVWQVTFIEESGNRCEEIMLKLENIGVGRVKKSSVSVLPVTIHCNLDDDADESEADEEAENEKNDEKVKQMEEKTSEFQKSIKSRLVVQQVVKSVESNAQFTFDYVMLIVLASMIAALGLVENSSVILVASMLISPLMGPILAGTFGIVVKNTLLRNLGVWSELKGLGICLICGFVCGLIPAGLEASSLKWRTVEEWPTLEMSSRGVARGLLVGIMIAVPSGAGVALSVLGGNTGSLVGVAISASLLPPAVNAGMLWSAALVSAIVPPPKVMEAQIYNVTVTINGTDINRTETVWVTKHVTEGYGLTCPHIKDNEYRHTYFCSTASDFAFLGAVSLLLTVLNIFCIFIMGIIVMKIKEVAPKTTTQSDKSFFKTDLKVARESYTTTKGPQSALMGKKWLEEYKAMKQQMEPDIVEEEGEEGDADTLEFAELLQSVENSPDVIEVLGRIGRSSRPMSEEMAPVFDQAYNTQHHKNPPSAYTTITHATYSGHYPTLRPHVSRTMFHFPPGGPTAYHSHANSPILTVPPLSAPIYTPIIEGEVLDTVQTGRRKPRKALRLRMPQKTYHVTPLGGKKTKATPVSAGTSSESSGLKASSTDTNGEDGRKAKAPKKARFLKGKKGKSFQSDAEASLDQIDEEIPMLETRPSNKNKNQNTSTTRI